MYYPDVADVPESQSVSVRNRSFSIGALVDIPAPGADGVLFAHGARFGGHSLYVKDNRLHYVNNFVGMFEQKVVATEDVPTGENLLLSASFDKDGEDPPHVSTGILSLYYNDKKVGEGRIKTQPGGFELAGEGLCVGRDSGAAVTDDYSGERPLPIHRRNDQPGRRRCKWRAVPRPRARGAGHDVAGVVGWPIPIPSSPGDRDRRKTRSRASSRSVTEPGDSFVPPSERIAAFDNDGTLWCEKPLYVQADFLFRRWKEMAAADPALLEKQPYKAVVEGDREWLAGALDHVPELLRGVAEACGGITTDAFETQVRSFFDEARHPTLGVPYMQVGYRPMVELLRFLETNGFRSFICTGGGRDFVRVVAEEMYAIPREQVIGSATTLSLQDGALIRGAEPEQPFDDGPGKPVHIWSRTGRLPLLAGGNSDGDSRCWRRLASVSWCTTTTQSASSRTTSAPSERSRRAATDGWTVASMRSDFADVF